MSNPFVLFIFFLFCITGIRSQSGFIWPIDSPHVITGNYGEIRPNHFHAGIDFSTGGRINKKIYAADDGYVSRIRVNAGAYGKCVYVTHPGNRVTVYAHLNSFNLAVSELVTKEQYARQSFELELLPAPGAIPVKRGEVVGLSGNSGSSSGPHLHFEVRDEKSETPLNPLDIYKKKDLLAPVLEALGFYDLSDTLIPRLVRSARVHSATVAQTFVVPVKVLGLAFMGHDRIDVKSSRNNVYGAELFFDGQLIYSHTLRAIDFADNRFANEFSETNGRLVFQKCFLPTLYPPRFYNSHVKKGRIHLDDTLFHAIRIVLRDEAGNTSAHTFSVRASSGENLVRQQLSGPLYADCRNDYFFRSGDMRLYIPAGTLYRSANLKIENDLSGAGRLSVMPRLNLRNAIVISCKVPAAYSDVAGKVLLRGPGGSVPATVKNDSLFFYPRNTGTFVMLADLDPPTVQTALSARKISRSSGFRSFSFRISDKLSGIAKYSMLVNGKWVIAEYDAKSDLLTCFFDEKTPKGPLTFTVEVEDRCGNSKTLVYRLSHR